MSEYSKLSYSARAKMANEDPDRYAQIKGEHDRAVERVEQLIASAKTHEEYATARAELERLSRPPGYDPKDYTATSGSDGVVANGLRVG